MQCALGRRLVYHRGAALLQAYQNMLAWINTIRFSSHLHSLPLSRLCCRFRDRQRLHPLLLRRRRGSRCYRWPLLLLLLLLRLLRRLLRRGSCLCGRRPRLAARLRRGVRRLLRLVLHGVADV